MELNSSQSFSNFAGHCRWRCLSFSSCWFPVAHFLHLVSELLCTGHYVVSEASEREREREREREKEAPRPLSLSLSLSLSCCLLLKRAPLYTIYRQSVSAGCTSAATVGSVVWMTWHSHGIWTHIKNNILCRKFDAINMSNLYSKMFKSGSCTSAIQI